MVRKTGEQGGGYQAVESTQWNDCAKKAFFPR
jgi:hypothetical protein